MSSLLWDKATQKNIKGSSKSRLSNNEDNLKVMMTFKFERKGKQAEAEVVPSSNLDNLFCHVEGGSNWPTLFLSIYHGQTARQK